MSVAGSEIDVTVNGDARRLASGTTIAELVARLAVRGRYAVEINGTIVPRSRHAAHAIAAGDRVEVVAAIGGG